MQYCEHASLNAVLVYYCDWVRHLGADVDVKAAVPQYININNAELCSMVGNLLENATGGHHPANAGREAAQSAHPVSFRPPAALFITVDTTRTAKPTPASNRSTAISSRPNMVARGLGTATVRRRPERHHGTASFEHSDGMFRASVMLCLGD